MAINPDLIKLRREIDRLLKEQRPDRYVVRDSVTEGDVEELGAEEVEDTRWLDEVAEQIADLVPDFEMRQLYARTLVGQREGRATRKANDLLRAIHRSGQLVLGWFDVKDYPVAVLTRVAPPGGRVKIMEERVALRAGSPADFRKFAAEERRRAAGDFSSRNDACAGAEWVADQMTEAGATTFLTWAENELPPDQP